MTRETLILVGRDSTSAVIGRHAERLGRRELVDVVETATYGAEPELSLPEQFDTPPGERTYVVPLCFAHTHRTLKDVPRALSGVSGEVRYCDPVGASPAVTDVIRSRASEAAASEALLLVGLGNSSREHGRETAEFHADRLRHDYAEVRTAYLLQSPAVECARYALAADHATVVPLFVASCDATERRIPERLELDRGGFSYADPLGDDDRVTDAIEAEIERERVLADAGSATAGTDLLAAAQPVATDGSGGSDGGRSDGGRGDDGESDDRRSDDGARSDGGDGNERSSRTE